jgi:NAD(P)-dependent dehydrogenase (short-subunit alcohol dehydrogenase family)
MFTIAKTPPNMSVIAVAGGTGGLGRAIVDAFVSEGKHTTLVLGREVHKPGNNWTDCISDHNLLQTSESKEKEIGTRILAVNYDDIDTLVAVLETNKIEVVISTLNLMQGAGAEHALIQAAAKSSVTKRYIPSIWGINYTEE